MARPALWRRSFAEFLGSALLAAVVIGSGIAAQRLSPGNVGLQLFENAAATAAGLVAIILTFGPVSGAHFNPVVSLADRAFGGSVHRRRAGLHPRPGRRLCGRRRPRQPDVSPPVRGAVHQDRAPAAGCGWPRPLATSGCCW